MLTTITMQYYALIAVLITAFVLIVGAVLIEIKGTYAEDKEYIEHHMSMLKKNINKEIK